MLCFVLDMSGQRSDRAVEDFNILLYEMECYLPGMTLRPAIVLANKIDMPGARDNAAYFTYEMSKRVVKGGNAALPVFPVSTLTTEGLEPAVAELRRLADLGSPY